MSRKKRLGVERLESRDTPATFGVPWADAGNITVSFAQDGTDVSGASSNLFAHLSADGMSAATWQNEVLRAIQSWASQANLNVGVVADLGGAIGTAGAGQHDANFGDIRISARSLGNDFLAITVPPSNGSSTLGGDIVINSDYHFSVGGSETTYDLYTTLLQETGHALGLANSSDTASAMYEWYHDPRTGLGGNDVSAIQALYGTRPADAFEAGGNETLATAKLVPSVAGTTTLYALADIAGPADTDYFRFSTTPTTRAPISIKLRTAGLSLLSASVTLYGAYGQTLATGTASAGGDVTLTAALYPNQTFYVAVRAASGTAFDVGAYKLSIVFTPTQADPAVTALAPVAAPIGTDTSGDAGTGTLTSTQPEFSSFGLGYPQFVSFDFTATAQGTPPTAIRVSIYDAATQTLVLTFDAIPGQTFNRTLLLGPGQYDVMYENIGGGDAVNYSLRATTLSDPIGIGAISGGQSGNIDTDLTSGQWAIIEGWSYYNWLMQNH